MNESIFNGMGNVYSNSRPSYPKAFIDYLYTDIGITPNSVIADIGSGTGKLTRLLLERGSKVFAVEPNADMRNSAESELSIFDKFISINCSAENTTLDDNSLDFITVATAFHWFNRQAFKVECKRILRKCSKVIIVYNSRDEESEIVKELYKVNGRYCPKFKGFTGSGTLLRPENAGFFNDFFAGEYETKVVNNDLLYDEQGFIGRCLSSSYALKESDTNYSIYINELESLFHKYSRNNILTMPNVTHSYVGGV